MSIPDPQPARIPGDLSGTRVGRFQVQSFVGAGGMGEVYSAEDSALKRRVALKRISPALRTDAHVVHQFRREAQRASALNHSSIAAIYDILEEHDEVLLVMEYVEGATLRERCGAPAPVAEVLRILRQCAEALAAAHEHHIMHLDLKPENIMLTPAGQVKVLDFGVAHQIGQSEASITTDGMLAMGGTLAYMAPEQLLGHGVDGRADIFALGVVGYELLTGRHPFRGENWGETLDRTLHASPKPVHNLNPAVWPQLEAIIDRMLAKDPAHRYTHARELLRDLEALERGGDTSTVVVLPSVTRRRRRNYVLLAVSALAVLLVAGLLWQRLRAKPGDTTPRMPAMKQVAVLPFRAIAASPEMESYSEGLAETVSARLTKLSSADRMEVVSAGEVKALKVKTVEQARKELGVNLVLEGSLEQSGDLVRVAFAVIDAASRRQLRADTITTQAADPFRLEDSVADAVMRALDLQPARGVAVAHGTNVNRAYEFYLRGQGELLDYDAPENVERAISDFSNALSLDPKFALAYAGRGRATWEKYKETRETALVDMARQDCARAVKLQAEAASPHVCLATVEDGTGQYEQAVGEFERALDSDPKNDAAYRGLGFAYEHVGRNEDAERTYLRAIRLRPQYWAGYNWLGTFYFRHMRLNDAAEQFKRAASLSPGNSRSHSNLGGVYVLLGRYQDAVPELQQAIDLRPNPTAYSNLGMANYCLRRFDQAVAAFEQAYRLNSSNYLLAGNLAEAYYWTPGKRAQSGDMFGRAIGLGEQQLKVNPSNVDALSNVAKWYAYQGRSKTALQELQRAMALQPKDASVLYRGAIVQNLLGNRTAALDLLRKALALGYSRSEAGAAIEFDNLRQDPQFQAIWKK